jgi:hypothetical protein
MRALLDFGNFRTFAVGDAFPRNLLVTDVGNLGAAQMARGATSIRNRILQYLGI